mgnify:CR=1 FL=1
MGQWQEDLVANIGQQVVTVPSPPVSGTRSIVAATATATELLPSGTRVGGTVFNDSDKDLFLGLGAVEVSSTFFTIKISPGGYYEVPYNFGGQVRGVWAASPTGYARITEVVA